MSWFRRTQLAWHVLHKEKVRLLVAVLGITFANMLIFMQLGFRGALFYSCGTLYRNLYGELFLVHPFQETMIQPLAFHREALYRCQAFAEVEQVQPVRVGLSGWRNPVTGKVRTIQVAAYDPGRCAMRGQETQCRELKVLGKVLFDRLGRPEFGPIEDLLRQGPVVTEVHRSRVEVAGTFNLGASFAADGCLVCSLQTFHQIFPEARAEECEFGLIRLRPGTSPQELQPRLQAFLGPDVRVLTRDQLDRLEETYWSTATPIGYIFSLGAAMGFLVGVVIVYQVLHSDITDHLPQYATLKAMGYSNRYLLTVLAQESLLLAVLGYFPGLALAQILYHQTASATALPIFMTVSRGLGVFAATVAMCLVSAAIAARRLVAADPAEIF